MNEFELGTGLFSFGNFEGSILTKKKLPRVPATTSSSEVAQTDQQSASTSGSKKKDGMYPTDAVISLVFTKLELNATLFGGAETATANEIIRFLQKSYPEYSKERTELQYDKKHNMIMPILKSGKRGCYKLEDTALFRRESSFMMDLTVYKKAATGSFSWKLPKIPFSVLHEIIHFFWDVYTFRKTEAIALIFYHPDNGYSIHIPRQYATPCTVEFERERSNEEIPVMEIHSHGQYSAFWSAQDDADELSHCIYGVAGNFKDFKYDDSHIITRAGTGGLHLQINPADIFDFPDSINQIHEWMSCFNQPNGERNGKYIL